MKAPPAEAPAINAMFGPGVGDTEGRCVPVVVADAPTAVVDTVLELVLVDEDTLDEDAPDEDALDVDDEPGTVANCAGNRFPIAHRPDTHGLLIQQPWNEGVAAAHVYHSPVVHFTFGQYEESFA